MKLKLDIPLNDKQKVMYNLLMEGRYTEFLFYGASRSGKTFLILYAMICRCLKFGAISLICRKTFRSLETGMISQTMPRVLEAIAKRNGRRSWKEMKDARGNPLFKYSTRHQQLKFYNGAYIQFGSLYADASSDFSTSYDNLLSVDWGDIFVDEASQMDFEPIENLYTRLAQKMKVPNLMLFALNPPSKLHWSYKRFFQHALPDGTPIDPEVVDAMFAMHFSKDDNKQFVSQSYEKSLSNLSAYNKTRFVDGFYSEVAVGKYFRNFCWEDRPPLQDVREVVIYTDPSIGSKSTNDFKATVTLVRGADMRTYFWDCRAVQGTTRAMLENIYELWLKSPIEAATIMEGRGVPSDYNSVLEIFRREKKWAGNITLDTRNHGDKFAFIESTLEHAVNSGQFVFCNELKRCGVYENIIDQFVRFDARVKSNEDRKDDIVDACAKGTSWLNRNMIMETQEFGSPIFFYRRGKLTSTVKLS